MTGECMNINITYPPEPCYEVKCIAYTDDKGNKVAKPNRTRLCKEDNACFNYVCNTTTNTTCYKEHKCAIPTNKCVEYVDCELNADGSPHCIYRDITCDEYKTKCNNAYCNETDGNCVVTDNSSSCERYACAEFVRCDNKDGCKYKNISCNDDNPCTIDECVEFDKYSEDDDSASDEVFSSSNDKTLPYVCVHKPKCTTPNFCETASCSADGDCSINKYDCKTESETNPTDTCHAYKCDEESRSCKVVLLPSAFLDVCGSCVKDYGSDPDLNGTIAKTACIGGMKATDAAAVIAGSTIAAIVIVCIIAAVAIGVASTLGTKELIKRAKKNADVGTNSNPLYEGNDNESTNPAFIGDN